VGRKIKKVWNFHQGATSTELQSEIFVSYLKVGLSTILPISAALSSSAFNSGLSGPGSSPGLRYCVVFLGKTLFSQCLSPPRGHGINVCFFISQPIQDKEIFAEDERAFLARQQVGLPFKITVRQRESVIYCTITSESVY